jgi:hypothetical protein
MVWKLKLLDIVHNRQVPSIKMHGRFVEAA